MKNILIIGGASGIGQALLRQLVAEGHQVYATHHNTPPSTEDAAVHWQPLDVMDESAQLTSLPEKLDGFVYCPGGIRLKTFGKVTPAELRDDYALMVLGAVRLLQQVLPNLHASGTASVVLFSTVAVQTGFAFHSAVAAPKGALEGLMRSLAAELAPGIRVNCVAPSLTDTPLATQLLNTPEKRESSDERHPMKRTGKPEDIAAAAVFLLTGNSGWITGQVIGVDGGMGRLR